MLHSHFPFSKTQNKVPREREAMVGRKKKAQGTNGGDQSSSSTSQGSTSDSSGYEQSRDIRIKENKERMQKLGIFDLSLKLKSHIAPRKRSSRDPSEKKAQTLPPPPGSPRRSSRSGHFFYFSHFFCLFSRKMKEKENFVFLGFVG